jgi:hypothetical protein
VNIELDVALKRLNQLQLEDGDLGAEYWFQIASLLREAQQYRARAEVAEKKLRLIQALLEEGRTS